jgi:hypothetical protein
MALVLALRGQVPPLTELPSGLSSWLYLGEGAAARIELEASLSGGLERISTADPLKRHAEALRRPYVDAIGSLSLLNASPEWWASELAAKSPYYRLFERICALAVARELLGSGLDGCLAVCATPALLVEVEAAAAAAAVETTVVEVPPPPAGSRPNLGSRLRWKLAFASARLRPWSRPAPTQDHAFKRDLLTSLGAVNEPLSGSGTALLFTWADGRNVTPQGSYVDPHFGWLPEGLRERGYRIAFLPRFLPRTDFADLARRLIGTGERFLFPELLLDEAVARRCDEASRAFSPVIPEESNVSGVPFARLAREHVGEHRDAQAANLVYRPLVEALGRAGVEPELVFHTFEGHAWEQVMAGAVRSYLPNTRVVGCDNLNLTRFALSRCPAAAELAVRPLPDRIVTNGPTARDELVAAGAPERIVVAGCGIRHSGLSRADTRPPAHEGTPATVLVATDASFDRAVELVGKAVEAFGSDDAWRLVVKCHPLLDRGALEAFVATATGVRDIYVDRPIPELLPGAGLLLYTYSSVCFEALAAGVPTVFVEAETDLDLDQLEPFPELRRTARTAAELRETARAILALSPAERERWRQRAREAVDAALEPVRPDCIEAFLP